MYSTFSLHLPRFPAALSRLEYSNHPFYNGVHQTNKKIIVNSFPAVLNILIDYVLLGRFVFRLFATFLTTTALTLLQHHIGLFTTRLANVNSILTLAPLHRNSCYFALR
jgi:uncharacterized membrane protein YGL010W